MAFLFVLCKGSRRTGKGARTAAPILRFPQTKTGAMYASWLKSPGSPFRVSHHAR